MLYSQLEAINNFRLKFLNRKEYLVERVGFLNFFFSVFFSNLLKKDLGPVGTTNDVWRARYGFEFQQLPICFNFSITVERIVLLYSNENWSLQSTLKISVGKTLRKKSNQLSGAVFFFQNLLLFMSSRFPVADLLASYIIIRAVSPHVGSPNLERSKFYTNRFHVSENFWRFFDTFTSTKLFLEKLNGFLTIKRLFSETSPPYNQNEPTQQTMRFTKSRKIFWAVRFFSSNPKDLSSFKKRISFLPNWMKYFSAKTFSLHRVPVYRFIWWTSNRKKELENYFCGARR